MLTRKNEHGALWECEMAVWIYAKDDEEHILVRRSCITGMRGFKFGINIYTKDSTSYSLKFQTEEETQKCFTKLCNEIYGYD